MRKEIVVILLALVVGMLSEASTSYGYHPLVKQGKKWHCLADRTYAGYDYENDQIIWADTYTDFVIEGDTMVNGLVYHKVYQTDSAGTGHEHKRYGFAIREAEHRVYKLTPDDSTENLLYDFELGITKEEIAVTASLKFIALSISLHKPGERLLRNYRCYPYDTDSSEQITALLQYCEGIGNTDAVFQNPMTLSGLKLISCHEDDVLIYDNAKSLSDEVSHDGDITGDELTDVNDINAIINMMLNKSIQTEWDDVAADMDNNLSIDINDINLTINLMLGN